MGGIHDFKEHWAGSLVKALTYRVLILILDLPQSTYFLEKLKLRSVLQ